MSFESNDTMGLSRICGPSLHVRELYGLPALALFFALPLADVERLRLVPGILGSRLVNCVDTCTMI